MAVVEPKAAVQSVSGLVSGWLAFQRWYTQVPALSVGISVGDDVVFADAWGLADAEAGVDATVDTRYRIASHSKVFTATAIMQLVESGDLRLDDPVAQHLSWFRSDDPDDDLSNTTVRHLLSHSSGITRDGATTHWIDDRFPSIEQIVEQVGSMPVYGPVQHLKYSNIGFTIAGQIIEVVSGRSYEDQVTETIIEPLGLTATTPDLPDDLTNHAVGSPRWLPNRERPPFDHVKAGVMNSATGFSSNVPDLLRWYQAHRFESGEMLHDRSKREMQRVQFEGHDLRWGLGFSLTKHGAMNFVTHGGGYPGFITYSGLEQEHGIAIVVLTNAADGPAQVWFDGIAKLIGRALAGDFEGEPPFDADIADQFTGYYEQRWGITQVARVGSKLVTNAPVSADPTTQLGVLDHVERMSFTFPTAHPIDSPGEVVRFEPGPTPRMHPPAAPPIERSDSLLR